MQYVGTLAGGRQGQGSVKVATRQSSASSGEMVRQGLGGLVPAETIACTLSLSARSWGW